jgi:hypothetical protein
MPRRSKITQLPKAIRDWFERVLIEQNFQHYQALEVEMRALGLKLGVKAESLPGKSALHRYGSNLERKLSAIKASTEAAAIIVKTSPDDADDRSAAVISLTQTGLMNILIDLEEAGAAEDPMQRAKLLSAVAKNVATLTRASIGLKRFRFEVQQRVAAAADAAAKIGKKGGLSKAGVEEIRREILGIVDSGK